jgi:hypothetical protein
MWVITNYSIYAVVLGHLFDQGRNLVCERRSAWFFLELELASPYPAEQVAVPAQDGIRLNDDQGLLPRTQLAGQEDDEGTISPGEFWTPHLPL